MAQWNNLSSDDPDAEYVTIGIFNGDFPARKYGLCKRHCPVTLRILWAVTS